MQRQYEQRSYSYALKNRKAFNRMFPPLVPAEQKTSPVPVKPTLARSSASKKRQEHQQQRSIGGGSGGSLTDRRAPDDLMLRHVSLL